MNELERKTLELTSWCEAYYEICNLMGRRSYDVLTRDPDIFQQYWCKNAPDPSFGVNEGYYLGYEAIREYYRAADEKERLKVSCMKKLYPGLEARSDRDLYGVGAVKADNLTTPIVQIAEDGQTAKGLWYYMLTDTNVDATGPQTYHQWGWIAADFIREDGKFRIWHMLTTRDFRFRAGGKWGTPDAPLPVVPELAPLAEFRMPEPNVKATLMEEYHGMRPLRAYPPMPVPYSTFSETFSYGPDEGGIPFTPQVCQKEFPSAAAGEEAAQQDLHDIQMVYDALHLRNLMGLHEYYHAFGLHKEELEAIWVSEPEHRESAVFMRMRGFDKIMGNYGMMNGFMYKRELEALRQKYPEIEDTPENLGIGRILMHALALPYIEVAGDGQTAQGVWYTPGMSGGSVGFRGDVLDEPMTMYMYEKYGIDFVKEDGEWKIWHLFVCGDQLGMDTTPLERAKQNGGTDPFAEKTPYTNQFNYSQFPPLPKPYQTYADTLSYDIGEEWMD